jgi:hypothetical protein
MKKIETAEMFDKMINHLMDYTYDFEQEGYWRCYVSNIGKHCLMLRKEEEDDRLIVINYYYPNHPQYKSRSYFIIENKIFDHDTRESVSQEEVINHIMDYYNNYYQG